jgi:hypothetical protein
MSPPDPSKERLFDTVRKSICDFTEPCANEESCPDNKRVGRRNCFSRAHDAVESIRSGGFRIMLVVKGGDQ